MSELEKSVLRIAGLQSPVPNRGHYSFRVTIIVAS